MASVVPDLPARGSPDQPTHTAAPSRAQNAWSWLAAHISPSVLGHGTGDVDKMLDLTDRTRFRSALKEIVIYCSFMIFFTIMTSRGITEAE